jgi:hypothetical protein
MPKPGEPGFNDLSDIPHRPAGRGNPAVFPDGSSAVAMARNHRAAKMVKRTVAEIMSGEAQGNRGTLSRITEIAKLRAARPWMCRLAEAEFEEADSLAVRKSVKERAYGRQVDLIEHWNPEVSQAALRQYFALTTVRQPANHKIDARHLHAVIQTTPEDLAIAARPIEEDDGA